MIATLEKAMAKRAGRPKSERHDRGVKIEVSLVTMARLVAAYKGTTMAALLSDYIRGPLGKDYAQMVRGMERAGDEKQAKS